MSNYQIVSKTNSFQKYIVDEDDLYADANSIDKWSLVFMELKEQGYNLDFCIMDLIWAYKNDTIEFLPEIC